MKFLVITKAKHFVPPEVLSQLIDAMEPWVNRNAGKIEQTWGFAGIAGGGGILTVDSLEELDAVMMEFPLGPVSDIEIIPLVDLADSIKRMKEVMASGG
jgi:muconolactone delta-isomerase